jgi:hypothetical protein
LFTMEFSSAASEAPAVTTALALWAESDRTSGRRFFSAPPLRLADARASLYCAFSSEAEEAEVAILLAGIAGAFTSCEEKLSIDEAFEALAVEAAILGDFFLAIAAGTTAVALFDVSGFEGRWVGLPFVVLSVEAAEATPLFRLLLPAEATDAPSIISDEEVRREAGCPAARFAAASPGDFAETNGRLPADAIGATPLLGANGEVAFLATNLVTTASGDLAGTTCLADVAPGDVAETDGRLPADAIGATPLLGADVEEACLATDLATATPGDLAGTTCLADVAPGDFAETDGRLPADAIGATPLLGAEVEEVCLATDLATVTSGDFVEATCLADVAPGDVAETDGRLPADAIGATPLLGADVEVACLATDLATAASGDFAEPEERILVFRLAEATVDALGLPGAGAPPGVVEVVFRGAAATAAVGTSCSSPAGPSTG